MTTLFSLQEFSTVQTGNVEAIQSIGNTLLEAGYKITLLNLELTRNTLNQGAAGVSALAGQDVQSLPFQPFARETAAYFKNLAHISAETQVEIARQIQAHMSEFGKTAASFLDRASKADSNVGTAMAAAALKSAVATATASCQGLTETTKRVTEIAQANADALAESVQSMGAQQGAAARAYNGKKAA